MALISCNFFSESLQVGCSMTVIMPQTTQDQVGVYSPASLPEGRPVLYLLHGLSDDHSAWVRYTSIERYANERGLAVVMPAVGRSFYANEAHGHPYWTFVAEELPSVVQSFFRVTTRRSRTFVAGLSMGGYGALKLGLSYPERFAGVASLSAVADVRKLAVWPNMTGLAERIFESKFLASDDIFELLDTVPIKIRPALYVSCGTDEERLIGDNQGFATRALELGYNVTTDFIPGDHDWDLWDSVIQRVIAWLPLDG